MRKLASVQRIAEIKPIEGADAIEAARINGWWLVVAKTNGNFVGQQVIYCEVDSWIPTELAPFLSKGHEPREFNGVKGERLRTVKLRGQLSQGLILPMPEGVIAEDGADLTEQLGIQKWEKPIPAQLAGVCRSTFPSCIPKTDQERIQNLPEVFEDGESGYQVSVKLDGSSMTVAWIDGEMHVCSRNQDLKLDQEGNSFVDTAKRIFGLEDRPLWNLAIQGELMGPGVQGNREKLPSHDFFVFDIFDIGRQQYFPPSKVEDFCLTHGLSHVPVIGYATLAGRDLQYVLDYAEGASLNHPIREGVVFKRENGNRFSFKAISNKFLLKEDK